MRRLIALLLVTCITLSCAKRPTDVAHSSPVDPAYPDFIGCWHYATADAPWAGYNFNAVATNDRILFFSGSEQQVWSTMNGKDWLLSDSLANWPARYYSYSAISFKGSIWLIGQPGLAYDTNDIWVSSSGANWQCVSPSAPWPPRNGMGVVVYQDKLWLLGGYHNGGPYYRDIWSSYDGVSWQKMSDSLPENYTGCNATVFNDRVFLVGGSISGLLSNKVYSTANGLNWIRHQDPPWSQRYPVLIVYENKLYAIAGSNDQNDMWYTSNGDIWVKSSSHVPWSARWDHVGVRYNNRIWIGGGTNGSSDFKDVWYWPKK